MPDDTTENMVTHSSRLQPSISCMFQLQPLYSAALVPNLITLRSGMKAQVKLETTIESYDLVYYLELEPVRHVIIMTCRLGVYCNMNLLVD